MDAPVGLIRGWRGSLFRSRLSAPTTLSHLHLERRAKLPGLGWWPPQVSSGLGIPAPLAVVCSNKDKDYSR